MKLVSEIAVPVNYTSDDIFMALERKLNLFKDEIESFEIVKESIDSRKKPKIFRVLNLAISPQKGGIKKLKRFPLALVDHSGLGYEKVNFNGKNPVIVGFGPAGMFAGLSLALAGLNPIIIEQGKSVLERQRDVDEFFNLGKLNKYSNIQFGEGGAGTFSDGKLTSNVSNAYTKKVINEFVLCGAPSEIFYSGTPHIGSDKLKEVVTNLRKKIESLGGKVLFNTKFTSLRKLSGKTIELEAINLELNEIQKFQTDAVILAVGHSAEDVYKFISKAGCNLKPKPFAMGVRIEQLQSDINLSQYGASFEDFPPANYKLVVHLPSGRSVFTFCMCPGGEVVASSSEENTIVTNGMSRYSRDGQNANSAVLVNVTPEDFEGSDALAGVEFQRKYEKLAFELGGKNYRAPAELVKDFVEGNENPTEKFFRVKPTYKPGVKIADLRKCLPDFVSESIKEALPLLSKKVEHFADDDNILIGVESRSSAPVQIVRDENFMTNIEGLFVCGEGSGYAGGITSSAADGIKCAEKVTAYLTQKQL